VDVVNIYEKNKDRFQAANEKIKRAYQHKETNELPIILSDVNYWVSGDTPSLIPEDYFTNFKSMLDFQVSKIENHLNKFNDDYIPLLFPWYGTGVVPSALGCNILFQSKMDPAVEGTVIKEPQDIRKLSLPDPYKDGLMPRVLKCIDYMKEHSDLPISFTDPQGPLNIALCLCGVENLFIWMYEEPEYVHEIMEFCTETFIQWVKVQKKHAGQQYHNGAFPHGIVLPEGFGGVWLSDDDCTVISPELYKKFVVPYNSRVFKAFGGGTLHFCGTAEHQLENFLKTEGLTGVNNFCMGNFRQVAKMQEMFEDKLALMICDFTPLNVEEYYSELISVLKFKGTILSTFISPECALVNEKYENITRDRDELMDKTNEIITRLVEEKRQKK
jgi:uroporphyrinogen-III decarboxylase